MLIYIYRLFNTSYAVATAEKPEGAFTKAKGVKKAAQREIRFSHYKDVVKLNKLEHRVTQFSLQSKNYLNRLMENNKIAFSSLYDTRYLICPIHSIPYHYTKMVKEYLTTGECPLCFKFREREAASSLASMMNYHNGIDSQVYDDSSLEFIAMQE